MWENIRVHYKTFEEWRNMMKDLFKRIPNFEHNPERTEDSIPNKLFKAYTKMKLKAEKRSRKRKVGKTKWEPTRNDLVPIKCQHASDAAQGVISKFQRPYEGPFLIREMINPNMYNVCDDQGKPRGLFHLRDLKNRRLIINDQNMLKMAIGHS
jgi:hypothetical protein